MNLKNIHEKKQRMNHKIKHTEIGRMPQDWKIKTLSNVCSNIIDCSHARKPRFLEKGNHIFLEVNNIGSNGFLDLREVKYVTKDDYQAWTKRLTPRHKDIVITKTGRVGAVAMIPEGMSCCIGRNQVLLRPNPNMVVPEFLLYYFLSPKFKSELKRLSLSGTILDSLHVKYIPELRLPYPEKEKQQNIADVFFPLYEKEKLNKEMNKTFEYIAQAIFKHWFVDFEFPNEEGKPYKSSGGEMVKSELGEIPRDWHVNTFSHLVMSIREPLKPGEHISNRKYVPIECIPMKQVGMLECKSYKDAKSSLIAFEPGDILFGAMRAYFHRVNYAPFKGVTRTTTFVLRPRNTSYFMYALFLLNKEESVDYANQCSTGTTIPYAIWENGLANMPIIMPYTQILEKFSQEISFILNRMNELPEEINTLSQIRDSLLPKLMAGKLEIKEMLR